ncbi:WSCD2 [Branchiostoma lanceolatum]|uniref:WSCD2 protein n=1 Tax=Branchiostoma lanceolatum TaxID=7740 RepID=A0A8K0F3I6_BRALA|nr:WSCD2 [Branchiostoma lanceolatum]
MTSHLLALVLTLTLLTGSMYPAKSMSSQEQQLNDEDASFDIEKAEALLKELEDLVEEEVIADNNNNNNGDDDDMSLLPEKRQLPNQFLYKGCYVDIRSRRFPNAPEFGNSQQTTARCVDRCRSKGFAYAGTQYSSECFCGTEQNFQSIGAPRPTSECNAPCRGNPREKCGGTWRMSVYKIQGIGHATDPNIAKGRPTFQSSVGHGGSPGRAVDGNRSPHWAHASCTHTNTENDPWWYVDLGRTVTVDHIAIVNRRDCCSERITPFDVHVGGSTTVAGNPRCGGHHRFHPTDTEKVVNCRGLRGRYVGIRLPGKSRVLTLCEVEVYAAPNLALGKPTVQSAVAHGGYASRATDGSRDPNWGSQSCTHTPAQSNPWLQVDLGSSTTVQWVILVNRADCCRERVSPFTVHIGNNPNIAYNPRCGGHHTIPAGKNKDAINCNGLRGRFVGIRLPGNGRILTLCEVEVYAGTITKKRTSEVRGAEGQGCGEHKEGESWVSPDEDEHNCMCDIGEEICYKVDCGTDGKQQPIKNQDGLWGCPEPEEKEETAREFLDETMEDWMDNFEE